MSSSTDETTSSPLTPDEKEWYEAVGRAETLAELQGITGEHSLHGAYFAAKERWQHLQEKRLQSVSEEGELPGDAVRVGDQVFVVHGITHANSEQERAFLHQRVSSYLDDGHEIYCEQGIRAMYFSSFDDVYEMDDYRWAMHHSRKQGLDSHIDGRLDPMIEDLTNEFNTIVSQFRSATFSLIESGSDVYGERFEKALGDIASDFLLSHEEVATAEDFRSFRKSRQAAKNPALLGDLQRYYKTALLPQPLEREWLRRHDPEIELMTHARNERIADYAVAHATEPTIHLIVGAAHQPGVTYYLEQHREGKRDTSEFELFE